MTKTKERGMGVLNIGYNKILLPIDDALAVFKAFEGAASVKTEWVPSTNKQVWKYTDMPEITLSIMSFVDVAKIAMEE